MAINHKTTQPIRRRVTLIYNGIQGQEVEVDRENVASSCHYFACLLNGPFKEAASERIAIFVDTDYVSFECFKKLVEFADSGKFIAETRPNYGIYFPMIQQASLWDMRKLIDVIECQLARYIDEGTVVNIHTLAARNGYRSLLDKCREFEQQLDCLGTPKRPITRCTLHDHQHHDYRWCNRKDLDPWTAQRAPEPNGSRRTTCYDVRLSEAQCEQLAEERDFNRNFVETSRFKKRSL